MSAFIPSQKDPKLITPVHSLEMMSPGDQDAGSRSVWLCGRASHGHDREAPAGLLKAEGLECFRGMRWTANVVRFGVRRSFHLVHSRASDSCQWLCLSSVLRWILIAITTQIRLPSLAPHKSNAPHKSVTRRTDRLTILLGEQDPECACIWSLEPRASGLWLCFSLATKRSGPGVEKSRSGLRVVWDTSHQVQGFRGKVLSTSN